MILFGRHGWENRFGDAYPRDTFKRWARNLFSRLRIDICFDEHDGFDVGAFVVTWRCSRGPFMWHRQSSCENLAHPVCCLLCPGKWRLMIALTPKAFDGFDEGASK